MGCAVVRTSGAEHEGGFVPESFDDLYPSFTKGA